MATMQQAPIDVLRAINNTISALDGTWRNREGSAAMVIADLRNGKSVIANCTIKAQGGDIARGTKVHLGMVRIESVIGMLKQAGPPAFLTEQEYADNERTTKLKVVRDNLRPVVMELEASQRQVQIAAAELQKTEEAVKHWRAELDAAQKKHEAAEKEASARLAKVNLSQYGLDI